MLVRTEVHKGVIVVSYVMAYNRTLAGGILSLGLFLRLSFGLTLRKVGFEFRLLSVLALPQETVCVSVTYVLDAFCVPAVLLCNHERQLLIGRSHVKDDLLIASM